jgi:hypothetical protein
MEGLFLPKLGRRGVKLVGEEILDSEPEEILENNNRLFFLDIY